MRLFLAISLPFEVIDALDRLSHSLRSANDSLRWSSPETWHITLQFLGETSVERHNCIIHQLADIHSPAVPIWLHGTGFFDRAGVFFAGVNVSPELRRLEKQVVAATSRCGVIAEDRPYHPHVTLARAKDDRRIDAFRRLKTRAKPDVEFPAFSAHEFQLYESFLGREGARHEIRQRFPLG